MDIVDPDALISVDIMIVEPNFHRDNWETMERIQVVSIQFNSLGMAFVTKKLTIPLHLTLI